LTQKNDHDKRKIKGQQPKKVDCGAMWVNAGLGIKWENVAHPMGKITNWCIHGCSFTLAINFGPNLKQMSILATPQGGM
jgi:hypothetical protein